MRKSLVGLVAFGALAAATASQAAPPDRPGQPIPNQNPPQEQGHPGPDHYPQQGQGWPNAQQGDQGGHRGWRRCDNRWYSEYLNELQQLSEIIRRGQRDGSYDPTTARKFNRAVAQDRAILDRDYQYDRCLDQNERNDLDIRINALKDQMRTYDRRPGRH